MISEEYIYSFKFSKECFLYIENKLRNTPKPNFSHIAQEVIDIFNLDKDATSLRKSVALIYRKIKETDDPSKMSLLTETIKRLGINEEDITDAKFINHLSKPSVNIKTKYSEHSSEEADLLTRIEEIVNKSKAIPYTYSTTTEEKTNKKAFIFWSSDKHVGACTENSMYENNYNPKVFRDRMIAQFKPLVTAYNTFGRFDKIIYTDLGDSLDGWNALTTRGGHKLPQNLNNVDAFATYVETTIEFFDKLIQLDFANSYEFIAQCNDNHSGDFGEIANKTIEKILNLKYPQVTTRIFNKTIEHFEYGAHTFLLCHGKDSTDMKFALPEVPTEKTSQWIKEYIENKNITTAYKHFIKGDIHKSSSFTMKWGRYKNVLSLYGSSKWIHNNFGNTRAGICFEVVDKHSESIWSNEMFFN